jgi:hypothetical protein
MWRIGVFPGMVCTHQFCRFVEYLLCIGDRGFPLLAACFGDLVQLLVQVGLHQLQLVLVAGEHLRAGVCVHGVCHNGGIFVGGVKVSKRG